MEEGTHCRHEVFKYSICVARWGRQVIVQVGVEELRLFECGELAEDGECGVTSSSGTLQG